MRIASTVYILPTPSFLTDQTIVSHFIFMVTLAKQFFFICIKSIEILLPHYHRRRFTLTWSIFYALILVFWCKVGSSLLLPSHFLQFLYLEVKMNKRSLARICHVITAMNISTCKVLVLVDPWIGQKTCGNRFWSDQCYRRYNMYMWLMERLIKVEVFSDHFWEIKHSLFLILFCCTNPAEMRWIFCVFQKQL